VKYIVNCEQIMKQSKVLDGGLNCVGACSWAAEEAVIASYCHGGVT